MRQYKERGNFLMNAWLYALFGIDRIERKLDRLEVLLMTTFSEYKTAIDESLASVLTLVSSESVEIQAAIQAALNSSSTSPDPAIAAALTELAEKRAAIEQAFSGLVSSEPSPTVPVDVPPILVPTDPLPELPPIEPVPVENPTTDPTVPVEISPSPDGVGVDDGSNVANS